MKLLIANRGEIAIRIAAAAHDLGIDTVAIHAEDDAQSLHVRRATESRSLGRSGVAAYLDIDRVLAVAAETGCTAVHPGYGFLAENSEFARRCESQGLSFVGPAAPTLALFGDKLQALDLARRSGIPVIEGTRGRTTLDEARAFQAALPAGQAMIVKAVAGGGGRGMRVVREAAALEAAWTRCAAEAQAAFGDGSLYVERLVERARHVEVQVVGDGQGGVTHLWERECSVQRRHQKILEIAPCPGLDSALRERLLSAACTMAESVNYRGLCTFEFLIDAAAPANAPVEARFAFIEANPRLQVEHTVTEEVTGVDLVHAQLRIAQGASLAQLGLRRDALPEPRGFAIQLRVNAETLGADGTARPSTGLLQAFEVPAGPGIRVDGYGRAGYRVGSAWDTLLAKLIVHHPSSSFVDCARRAARAAAEFRIDGVSTTLPLLRALLARDEVRRGAAWTRYIEEHQVELLAQAQALIEEDRKQAAAHGAGASEASPTAPGAVDAFAGVQGPQDSVMVAAPLQGTVISVEVREGERFSPGACVVVLESMKMQHEVSVPHDGSVVRCDVRAGETVLEGQPLLWVREGSAQLETHAAHQARDLDHIRADLAESITRHGYGLDASRPEAVARRHKAGGRTGRENVADLIDAGSFLEYGALAVAAQRTRRSMDDLMRNTPGDGMVCGIATVNAALFDAQRARCMVLAYDYTVLAGTQGAYNHKKTDRLLHLAEQWKLPIVLFAEGGGGRPGDVDWPGVGWLDVTTFQRFAGLSGLVPRVGLVNGYCFAGNAALLGCCDVIIATRSSSIGMGGPAMIEGGGLGRCAPGEVGPVSVQVPNGVIDVLVDDEAHAVRVARQYLSYFQGAVSTWEAPDPRALRAVIPENRLRVYEIRDAIAGIADVGSVLELRAGYGVGIVTAFIRVAGRPMALIANNPKHLGGAIDAEAAEKAARFLQLADAFDLPVLSLCDTPGFMVGPQAEKQATVRRVSRLFVTASSMSVPFFTVVLRKGYGLGAQAMTAGGFAAPFFTVSWPSGEFGAMGLEGSVRLGFRKELEAVADEAERAKLYDTLVAQAYERGKALNMASALEIDEVIDPAETRHWILRGLDSVPAPLPRAGKKRNFVDTW